jgi:hypothetical protein
MNTGQTLLTVGALVLFSIIILNGNRILTENNDVMNYTRFQLESIALATSIIEEASQLPFDEVSWDSTKIEKKVSDFTQNQHLGIDGGESNYQTFDDFDDFHKYAKAETTSQNIYKIACSVDYVSDSKPNVALTNRSYFKKLSVSITSPSVEDTLNVSYVHGYWYFN